MTESSKFTRREVIDGVTMVLLPPVAGAAEVPSPRDPRIRGYDRDIAGQQLCPPAASRSS
jgi:hypothetical protein